MAGLWLIIYVEVIRFDEKAFDALSKKCKNYYFFCYLIYWDSFALSIWPFDGL